MCRIPNIHESKAEKLLGKKNQKYLQFTIQHFNFCKHLQFTVKYVDFWNVDK